MTLTSVLSETNTKDLLRAINSNKEYLFFDISVFNAGAVINIKCTDIYKEINPNTWNGYDFIIENDETTKYYIAKELEQRLRVKTTDKELNKILLAVDMYGDSEISEADIREYRNLE